MALTRFPATQALTFRVLLAWATGGSNSKEHWFNASELGSSLNNDTEESCTQYNVLKVHAIPVLAVLDDTTGFP